MRNDRNHTRIAIFLGMIMAQVFAYSSVALAADIMDLPASAEEVNPLRAGDRAPRFTVRTVDNEPFTFDPDNLDAPVMLITFRGGWCPYCNTHLSELRNVIPELKEKGIDVFFLSGDRPEMLYESLKMETQEDIDGQGYTIYSDADIEAARALGIAFRAADSTIERRMQRGQDIDGSSMINHHALPVPAVYVINQRGDITFDYVNPDYAVRIPTEDLVAAALDVLE